MTLDHLWAGWRSEYISGSPPIRCRGRASSARCRRWTTPSDDPRAHDHAHADGHRTPTSGHLLMRAVAPRSRPPARSTRVSRQAHVRGQRANRARRRPARWGERQRTSVAPQRQGSRGPPPRCPIGRRHRLHDGRGQTSCSPSLLKATSFWRCGGGRVGSVTDESGNVEPDIARTKPCAKSRCHELRRATVFPDIAEAPGAGTVYLVLAGTCLAQQWAKKARTKACCGLLYSR